MDDLLREFPTESAEHLGTVDAELVRLGRDPMDDPMDQAVPRHVFRLVHTVKSTCGFLGLPRLEALAHAAETLMSLHRDGVPVSAETVALVLSTLDRLKGLLGTLEATGVEPDGDDADLVGALGRMAEAAVPAPATTLPPSKDGTAPHPGGGTGVDALETAFLAASGPDDLPAGGMTGFRPDAGAAAEWALAVDGAPWRSGCIAWTGDCSSSSTSIPSSPSSRPPRPPEARDGPRHRCLPNPAEADPCHMRPPP